MLKRLVLIAVAAAVVPLSSASISQDDRDALLRDLERSRVKFIQAILDVTTDEQWNYKPAPDRWSVGECAAHIIAAEEYFRQNVETALKSAPIPAAQRDRARDAIISTMIRDRSQRFQAPAALEPAGKVVPRRQALVDFEATRSATLTYVRKTEDPLHEHGSGTPPNVMTAYQLLLMLSGHTERHTEQLLEVKASPGYPKS
jgi:uncharacterized damage-inducible protein DinB